MAHATHPSGTRADLATLNLPIGRVCCAGCVKLIERRLRENPDVVRVHVDAAAGVAHVDVQAGKTSVVELAELARECCGGRCPAPMPDAVVSSHHHAHTAKLEDGADAPEARAAEHARLVNGAWPSAKNADRLVADLPAMAIRAVQHVTPPALAETRHLR